MSRAPLSAGGLPSAVRVRTLVQRDPLGRRCLAGLDGNEHPAGWATEGLPSRTPRSSGRKDRGETVMAAPVSEPRSTCPGWGWCRPLSQRTNWGAWVSQGQVARGRPSPLTPGSHWAAAGGRGCPLPTLTSANDSDLSPSANICLPAPEPQVKSRPVLASLCTGHRAPGCSEVPHLQCPEPRFLICKAGCQGNPCCLKHL